MKYRIIIIIYGLLLVSCSSLNPKSSSGTILKKSKKVFLLTDSSGEFKVVRETVHKKAKNEFIVRKSIYPKDKKESSPVERCITISTPGRLKKIAVLRPKISQYYVWFEDSKEKYFTQLKINLKKKNLDIIMKSPEKQWNGSRSVPFPSGTGVYCFFSQLIECVGVTGFIKKASRKNTGKMNFYVIWDSYPYVQEQFLNMPDSVFSTAVLEYDGMNKNGERRFTLKVAGQSIFYFVNNNGQLVKKFWASQGLSMVRSDL